MQIFSDVLPEGVDIATAAGWPRPKDAARLLGLSVKTLRRRVLAGRLAAYDVAGVTRFNPADLAAGVKAVEPVARRRQVKTGAAAKRRLNKFFRRGKA
jgi:hypothetical protein